MSWDEISSLAVIINNGEHHSSTMNLIAVPLSALVWWFCQQIFGQWVKSYISPRIDSWILAKIKYVGNKNNWPTFLFNFNRFLYGIVSIVRTVFRWPKYRRRIWLQKTRFNSIMVQSTIAKSNTYFICFIFSFPIMITALSHLSNNLDKHLVCIVTIFIASPMFLFEYLWISYSGKVNDLRISSDKFRKSSGH